MHLKADLTVKETDRPVTGRCDSGHYVPPPSHPNGLHDREGNGKKTPIRFFRVSGQNQDGTYCEPCLVVANWLAAGQKGRANG